MPITAQENQGRQIFFGNGRCAACHGTDNFVPSPALNNNGLEFPYVDLGVGGTTGNPADNGKFNHRDEEKWSDPFNYGN